MDYSFGIILNEEDFSQKPFRIKGLKRSFMTFIPNSFQIAIDQGIYEWQKINHTSFLNIYWCQFTNNSKKIQEKWCSQCETCILENGKIDIKR